MVSKSSKSSIKYIDKKNTLIVQVLQKNNMR